VGSRTEVGQSCLKVLAPRTLDSDASRTAECPQSSSQRITVKRHFQDSAGGLSPFCMYIYLQKDPILSRWSWGGCHPRASRQRRRGMLIALGIYT
jgi:hypothetical protein